MSREIWSREKGPKLRFQCDHTGRMIFEHFSCTCCLFCQLFSEAHKPLCMCVCVRAHSFTSRRSPPVPFDSLAILLKLATYNCQAHSSTACMHAYMRTDERTNQQVHMASLCVCLSNRSHYSSFMYTHAHAQGNFHPFLYFLVCVRSNVTICLITNTQAHTETCVMYCLLVLTVCKLCSTRRFLFAVTLAFLRQNRGAKKSSQLTRNT